MLKYIKKTNTLLKYFVWSLLLCAIFLVSILTIRKYINYQVMLETNKEEYIKHINSLKKNEYIYNQFIDIVEINYDKDFWFSNYFKNNFNSLKPAEFINSVSLWESGIFLILSWNKTYEFYYPYDKINIWDIVWKWSIVEKQISWNWYIVLNPRRCKLFLERWEFCYDSFE